MSRPISDWYGFMGQRAIVRVLRRVVEGAKAQGRTVGPVILTGPSGSGKTTLANAVAKCQGTQQRVLVARPDLKLVDLVEELKPLQAGDSFFVDEIQSLSPELQEVLFRLIDDGRVPNINAVDGFAPGLVAERFIKIPQITLIATTDRPGTLLQPLKRRFALTLQFGPYTLREMLVITRQRATEFGMLLTSQSAKLLAQTSRGIPRLVGQRLRVLRDYYGANPPSEYTAGHVDKFLKSLRIDATGMTQQDRSYLTFLGDMGGKGASLRMIACKLELDPNAVASDIEPHMIRQNLIIITPGGRVLSDVGQEFARKLKEGSE